MCSFSPKVMWQLERKSIGIERELHGRILKFRAFFMSHGIDVSYADALNFLALRGYDELMRSGFDETLLERLDSKAASDEAIRKVISSDWLNGRMQGVSISDGRRKARDTQVAHGTQLPSFAGTTKKAVVARCMRCKTARTMKNPEVVELKNGKQAVEGTCSVCGSKMTRFGVPK